MTTDDITVTATYSDDTSEVISDATIDASSVKMNVSGDYSIVVEYRGQSASIAITVEDAPTPAGTVIYEIDSIRGDCKGTDLGLGAGTTSWTSGKQYRYEMDYEVLVVADDTTTVSIRDCNASAFNDKEGILVNAVVGMTGHIDSIQNNSNTRKRAPILLKATDGKSYSVNLTNVKITEL